MSQLERARQDTAKECREVEASRAETLAAKLSTDAVAAEKTRAEEKLAQQLEEHAKLNEVIAQHAWLVARADVTSKDHVMFRRMLGFK